jgi:hypothetical protein
VAKTKQKAKKESLIPSAVKAMPDLFKRRKYITPVVLVAAMITVVLMGISTISLSETTNEPNTTSSLLFRKPVIELDSFEVESLLTELLDANSVIIYSDPVAVDLYNNSVEEIVVVAYVSGGRYPLINGRYTTRDPVGSIDLIALVNTDGETTIASYSRNIGVSSASPFIYTGDIFGDGKSEIIVTSYDIYSENYQNTTKIFSAEGLQLTAAKFSGGEFDGKDTLRGFLLDLDVHGIIKIAYGYHKSVYDTYEWSEAGKLYELKETAATSPEPDKQKVINYISNNLTNIVRSKPILGATEFNNNLIQFYPGSILITNYSDGHVLGVLAARYEISGNQIFIRHLKEGVFENDFVKGLREELKLNTNSAKSYFLSNDTDIPWKYTPTDVFAL